MLFRSGDHCRSHVRMYCASILTRSPQECKSDDNRTTASASGAHNVHGWDVAKKEEALASAKVWDGGPRCEEHPRGPTHLK